MGAPRKRDYPRTLAEFYRRFPDDDACLRYLVETRWPDGFRCPACGSDNAVLMAERRRWSCRACRLQTSATAGTTLHGSKVPLHAWFQAAWLMTSLKPGISALQLQGQLGLSRFGTAWLLLHKLRAATVDPERTPLRGAIEIDDAWVGGKQAGLRGGHQRAGRTAVQIVVAVERKATSLGRTRMEVIADDSATTLGDFVRRNIAPGATIATDAHPGYAAGIDATLYAHTSMSQSAQKRASGVHQSAVPGVDRVISNLKTWLRGTHHGVGADHLPAYLDEFVFRFNRRYTPMAGFATLLGLSVVAGPTTRAGISPSPATGGTKRRGRATGQTSLRFPNPPAILKDLDPGASATTVDAAPKEESRVP